MFPKITPRNNEWNRNNNITEESGSGFLMDMKLSQAFFAWKFSEDDIKFYKCEEGVFEKSFSIEKEMVEHEFDPFDNVHFLRYPLEK